MQLDLLPLFRQSSLSLFFSFLALAFPCFLNTRIRYTSWIFKIFSTIIKTTNLLCAPHACHHSLPLSQPLPPLLIITTTGHLLALGLTVVNPFLGDLIWADIDVFIPENDLIIASGKDAANNSFNDQPSQFIIALIRVNVLMFVNTLRAVNLLATYVLFDPLFKMSRWLIPSSTTISRLLWLVIDVHTPAKDPTSAIVASHLRARQHSHVINDAMNQGRNHPCHLL